MFLLPTDQIFFQHVSGNTAIFFLRLPTASECDRLVRRAFLCISLLAHLYFVLLHVFYTVHVHINEN